eukprot:gene10384-21643_t
MEPTCVLNHVLASQVLTTELKMGEQRLTNAAGGALWVTKTVDGITVGNSDRSIVANVIAADNMASNGVAHIIDAVLRPPASAPPATTTIKATTTTTKTTKTKTATRYACNEKTFTCDPSPVGYNSSTLCHEGCVDPTMRYYACDSKTFACNPAPIGYNSSASCQNGRLRGSNLNRNDSTATSSDLQSNASSLQPPSPSDGMPTYAYGAIAGGPLLSLSLVVFLAYRGGRAKVLQRLHSTYSGGDDGGEDGDGLELICYSNEFESSRTNCKNSINVDLDHQMPPNERCVHASEA